MKQFRQFFGMSFLPLLLILVSFNLFSQSKKDLQLQVDSLSVKNKVLEEKFRQVEGEMKIIQTKLFSQSQKDLQLQIDSLFIRNKSLEDKLKYMDGDLKNIQTNLLSVSTTMNMVSKFSTELENQVKAQSIVLQKLMAQNDSLRKTSIGKVEEKTVTVPKNEADSIIYAVQQYYAAKKWQNRLPFVLNKEKVEPLMEEAYQNNFRSYEIDKQSINIPGSRYVLGKTFKIFVDGEIVYIRKTNEGFKLDWEATKGYNAIDPSVVCAEKNKYCD